MQVELVKQTVNENDLCLQDFFDNTQETLFSAFFEQIWFFSEVSTFYILSDSSLLSYQCLYQHHFLFLLVIHLHFSFRTSRICIYIQVKLVKQVMNAKDLFVLPPPFLCFLCVSLLELPLFGSKQCNDALEEEEEEEIRKRKTSQRLGSYIFMVGLRDHFTTL